MIVDHFIEVEPYLRDWLVDEISTAQDDSMQFEWGELNSKLDFFRGKLRFVAPFRISPGWRQNYDHCHLLSSAPRWARVESGANQYHQLVLQLEAFHQTNERMTPFSVVMMVTVVMGSSAPG